MRCVPPPVLLAALAIGTPALAEGVGCYADVVTADGPSLYWRLGDASAPLQDTSGHSNPGVPHGPVARGQLGALLRDSDGAIHVDGDTAYVDATTATNSGDAFSLELWARADFSDEDRWPVVLRQSDDVARYLRIRTGAFETGVSLNTPATGATRSPTLDVTQWHHVVYVIEGGVHVHLYVDGKEAATTDVSPLASVTGKLTLAWEPADVIIDDRFTGLLDEVALYDRALGADPVALHQLAGVRTGSPWGAGATCCYAGDCQSGRCTSGTCEAGTGGAGGGSAGGGSGGSGVAPSLDKDPFVIACDAGPAGIVAPALLIVASAAARRRRPATSRARSPVTARARSR